MSHRGYEPITIDGIECEIGWTNTDYSGDDYIDFEEHWVVLRHGCQIGKSTDRERAIEKALERLTKGGPHAWLRGPRPDHFGKST